jgi:hypothetical protein
MIWYPQLTCLAFSYPELTLNRIAMEPYKLMKFGFWDGIMSVFKGSLNGKISKHLKDFFGSAIANSQFSQ